MWRGGSTEIYHIAEFYNYDDVFAYHRDVLGVDENPRLEGLHDDYYITSIITNDDPRHVRLEQRIKAGKASINGISIVPAEKTMEHGRRLIEKRPFLENFTTRFLHSCAPGASVPRPADRDWTGRRPELRSR